MKPTVFKTSDGSPSLFSTQFEVSYHSKHGAIQETQHVFIDAAFSPKAAIQSSISILDIGFGTGLNAFMTYLEALKQGVSVSYTGVEAYPIDMDIVQQLDYAKLLNVPNKQDIFLQMHTSNWNQPFDLQPSFQFTKLLQTFENLDCTNQFDVIYFDAFAPDCQPELWNAALLASMYKALKPNGYLTTYCAKGVVKRTMKAVGFEVEGLPGPPGKREMTRGTRQN